MKLEDVTKCWPEAGEPLNWFCFEGNKDAYACNGDSGGPVMVKKINEIKEER